MKNVYESVLSVKCQNKYVIEGQIRDSFLARILLRREHRQQLKISEQQHKEKENNYTYMHTYTYAYTYNTYLYICHGYVVTT